MSFSSSPGLATRGLSILREVGAWMTIRPEQTYVATSIPGLGVCKSTYCRAERREVAGTPVRRGSGRRLRGRLIVAAMVGILSGCASYRPLADVTNPGACGRDLADCQKFAVPVSPGAGLADAGIGLAETARNDRADAASPAASAVAGEGDRPGGEPASGGRVDLG